MKKTYLILKILFVIVIVYLLFLYNIIQIPSINILLNKYLFIILPLLFITLLTASFSWWLLLRAENYNIPLITTYHIYATGSFFNIFMPGGTGGDVVKGIYMYRYIKPSQRTPGIFSIIVQRILGMHALLSISLIMGLLLFDKIFVNEELFFIFLALLILVVMSIFLLGLFFLFTDKIIYKVQPKDNLEISKTRAIILRILQSLRTYKSKKIILFSCWLISAFNHILISSSLILMAEIINLNHLNLFEVIFASGISIVTNAIPLTPGGIGIGESAYNYLSITFLQNTGLENFAYGSIFFIGYRIMLSIVTLIGALSFVIIKKPEDKFETLKQE